MTPTEELINAILRRKPANLPESDVGKYLAQELDRIDLIQRNISRINTEVASAQKTAADFAQRGKERIAEQQRDCPHYAQTYHGDPAGGSDSSHSCNHCGKTT